MSPKRGKHHTTTKRLLIESEQVGIFFVTVQKVSYVTRTYSIDFCYTSALIISINALQGKSASVRILILKHLAR